MKQSTVALLLVLAATIYAAWFYTTHEKQFRHEFTGYRGEARVNDFLAADLLLNELGVEAKEALMIGDTEYDLQMASNARMPSLAVSYGVHEVERLNQHNPVGCVDDINQMARWLIGKD